jgi:hypothetical protein
MKKLMMLMLAAACYQAGYSQSDTTKPKEGGDTIRVGSIIIVNKGGSNYDVTNNPTYKKRTYKRSNISTNWLVFDIGYSGLWFFMQRLNLYKHVINLQYGFGIENNNYYYKTPITYVDGGTVFVKRDDVLFSKNKLAADYFTSPLMLNFNATPNARNGGIQLSVGVSGGFLYSARQKQKSDERGKQKEKTDFNLERWKLAYVAELGIGPVKLFGSYAFTPLHKYGVEQYPYNVGVRFSADTW